MYICDQVVNLLILLPVNLIKNTMRIMFLFAILLLSSFACNAQIDYGLYVRHQQLGEYDAQYQFFYNDGVFTYCTDMYNNLTGHVCISGRFEISGDSISFYELSIEVPVLSDLTRISPKEIGEERIMSGPSAEMRQRPSSSNYWSRLGDESRQKIKIDNNKRYTASFFRQENDEYIEIDGERFYEDPGPSD